MRVQADQKVTFDVSYCSMEASIEKALTGSIPKLPGRKGPVDEKNTVRSVQRLPNPAGKDCRWVANAYPEWLSRTFRYFLRAKKSEDLVSFNLFGITLLQLRYIEDRSDVGRQLFYIVGGKLVKRTDYGWLEFRSVLDNTAVIAAIHEFVPKLPWMVYKSTQAVLHLWVMKRFGTWLRRQS